MITRNRNLILAAAIIAAAALMVSLPSGDGTISTDACTDNLGWECTQDDRAPETGSSGTELSDCIRTGQCGNDLTWEYNACTGILVIAGTGAMWDHCFDYNYSLEYCAHTVILPDGLTSIGSYSLHLFIALASIEIPDSVKEIGDHAFLDCWHMTSITIPSSVTEIGDHAFDGCWDLTSIDIPSVTAIKDGTFCNCITLTSVIIPSSVTAIGNDVFARCYRLSWVSVPSSVTAIGSGVFTNCYDLKTVYDLSELNIQPGEYGLSSDVTIVHGEPTASCIFQAYDICSVIFPLKTAMHEDVRTWP